MEPLEHLEDKVLIVRINSNAFVADRNDNLRPFLTFGRDVDNRRFLFAVLNCVLWEVLEQLSELNDIPFDMREFLNDDLRVTVLNRLLEIGLYVRSHVVQIDRSH